MDTSKLLPGDTILYSGSSILAKSIQLFESSPWNHVSFVVNNNGTLQVIEALGHGVQFNTFEDSFKGNKNICAIRPNFAFDSDKCNEFALSLVGKEPYDFVDLILKQPFYTVTGHWLWNPEGDGHRLICAEVPVYVFHSCNEMLFTNWGEYNPKMLANSMQFTQVQ